MRTLKVLRLLLTLIALPSLAQVTADPARIQARIDKLATFGGTPEGGTSRPGFSEADKAAREWLIGELAGLGLSIRMDAAGNIIATRRGSNPKLPAIAFGSHIDSVPNGGNYDGQAGVVAAMEVMSMLNDAGITTRHPLELLVFVAEEDGLFGSAAMIGKLTEEDLTFVTNSGRSVAEGIDFLGGVSEAVAMAERSPAELAAFIELHIEQGPHLDSAGIDIGVVQGIVGIDEWAIAVQGTANHAGTTPMNARQDALLAASKLVVAVNETVNAIGGRLVGTVGELKAHPNVSNIVPGRVDLVLEMRDLDHAPVAAAIAKIRERAAAIAEAGDVAITITPTLTHTAAPTNPAIQAAIQAAADELGYSSLAMPSGAGHDAQNMATRWPTGMIFVPSRDGVSHSPEEFTKAIDLAAGAAVLYRTVLKLDSEEVGI
jgi:N-carbamoyl-L-amino-acid hydrolase